MDRVRAKATRRLLPALCAGIALAGAALASWPAAAAELVMFRVPGCSWCAAWDREVGDAYPDSPEARIAPLREVRLDRDRDGGLKLQRRVRYTPTFVLAHNGVEVGRIAGYPGESFFWSQLGQLLEKLDAADAGADSGGPDAARNDVRQDTGS
jgi:hypothetical protein